MTSAQVTFGEFGVALLREVFTPEFLQESLTALDSPELLQTKRLMALVILELWFQTFVDQPGLAPVADSWLPRDNVLRKEAESAIAQYPYDPNAAQRLLTDAGNH